MARTAEGSESTTGVTAEGSELCAVYPLIFCIGALIMLVSTGILLLINSSVVYERSNCSVTLHGEPCVKSKAEFECVDSLVAAAQTGGIIGVIPGFNVLFVFSLLPLTLAHYEVKHTQITVFRDSASSKTVDMTCDAFIKVHTPDLLLACEIGMFMGWFVLLWWLILFAVAYKTDSLPSFTDT